MSAVDRLATATATGTRAREHPRGHVHEGAADGESTAAAGGMTVESRYITPHRSKIERIDVVI